MHVFPSTIANKSGRKKVSKDEDQFLEFLICQPHDFFGFSVYELVNIDRQTAIRKIMARVGPQYMETVEQYFIIIDRLRGCGRLPSDLAKK